MKHLKRKAFVTSNVGRVAVATGLSLSMIAGNYLAIPHVALADDAPRSAFSEYAELVQKYANANLDAQDRSRLKNEIADAKKAYKNLLRVLSKNMLMLFKSMLTLESLRAISLLNCAIMLKRLKKHGLPIRMVSKILP